MTAVLIGALLLTAQLLLAARLGAGVLAAFALVVVLLAAVAPYLAFALLLEALIFQNAVIAAVLPQSSSPVDLVMLQATSLIFSLAVACVAVPAIVLRRSRLEAGTLPALIAGLCFAGVVIGYVIYGALVADITSASAYARIYLIGPILLACGVFFRHQLSKGFCVDVICALGWLLVFWGIAELLAPRELYAVFDVPRFMNLKFAALPSGDYFPSVAAAIETFTRPFLNLSGKFGLDIKFLRLNGPNLHPISYGYAVTACTLVAVLARKQVLTVVSLALALLIGAKGPLMLLLVGIGLTGLHQIARSAALLAVLLGTTLLLYIGVGLAYGVASGDYHVIGLVRGVRGFLGNPFGHGIGVGGNVSAMAQNTSAWTHFENNDATFALESAVGVVLYQIGVGGLALVAFFVGTFKLLWRRAFGCPDEPKAVILPIALATLAVNGLFQEEALSPAGWGLLLFIAAFASPSLRRAPDTTPEKGVVLKS